jgi:hypothetical protein
MDDQDARCPLGGHRRFICRRAMINAMASINSFNCCRSSVPWSVAVVALFFFTALSFIFKETSLPKS